MWKEGHIMFTFFMLVCERSYHTFFFFSSHYRLFFEMPIFWSRGNAITAGRAMFRPVFPGNARGSTMQVLASSQWRWKILWMRILEHRGHRCSYACVHVWRTMECIFQDITYTLTKKGDGMARLDAGWRGCRWGLTILNLHFVMQMPCRWRWSGLLVHPADCSYLF